MSRQGVGELVVIGAGPAGLCAAWAARAHGWEATVIDRNSAVGGAWAHMRPDMRCLSPARYDRLPDGTTPAPAAPGDTRATAMNVVAAIRSFAARARFDLRLDTEVEAVRWDGELFSIRAGGQELRARRVLVASGEHANPWRPRMPGTFDGPTTHARDVVVEDVRPGERVVVIGCGNSAAELVPLLVARGARVVVSTGRALERPPGGYDRGAVAALRWRASALPLRWIPGRGGCADQTPVVDPGLYDAITSGRAATVGHTARLHPDGLETRSGERVVADRIVWATGYLRDTACLRGLVARDARGVPRQTQGVSPELPRLGFVGIACMRTRRSGFLRGFAGDAAHVVAALAR